MSKPISKPIIALASSVAGLSTALIVPSSASKPAATAALFKPAPVKSARSAIKGSSIVKDPFMVRQFKLAGIEESENKEGNDNEDGKGDDDNSNDDDVTMDVDSAKRPEKTRPAAPIKAMVIKVKVPALVPVANKTEEDTLLQI
ncbi:hypothetical protein C0995_001269, partial [Termitomyces sp. Mi166